MSRVRIAFTALLVCALVAVVGSPANAAEAAGKSSKPVKIGRFTFPGGEASGTPIKVGVIASDARTPTIFASARGLEDYVNEKLGGIGGQPLEFVYCDEKADPAASAACSQQFKDAGVVGVIGFPLVWALVNGPSQLAPIPALGLADAKTLTIPNGWPILGGAMQTTSLLPMAEIAKAKSVALVGVDFPISKGNAALNDPLLEAAGIEKVSDSPVKVDWSNLETQIAAAVDSNPDAIHILLDGPHSAQAAQIARQRGFKGDLLFGFALDDQSSAAGGEALEGALRESGQIVDVMDKGPEAKAYRKMIDGVTGISAPDGFSAQQTAWTLTLVDIANQIAKKGGKVDAASITDSVKNAASQPVFMGYQLDAGEKGSDPTLANLLNSFNRIQRFKNGKWVDLGKWYSAYGEAEPGVGAQTKS